MKLNNARPHIFFTALLFIVLTGVLMAIAGCHHNGGGGFNTSQISVTVNPANGARDITLDSAVTATFSRDMDSATIDGSSFTVGDSTGAALNGTVIFDSASNMATFTPDSSLGLFRTYTATLTTDITSLDGTAITQHNWSFTTIDGAWSAAQTIQVTDAAPNTLPKVAFDGAGNAIAVWIEDNNVYTNRYNAASSTWGSASSIASASSTILDSIHIAADTNGTAIAVWPESQGPAKNIKAARYNGTTWEADVGLEPNGGIAQYSQVAMDGAGNAIVVWRQPNGGANNNIWYNRYDAVGATWGAASTVESGPTEAYPPDLAINDSGDTVTVWAKDNGSGTNIIYASHYATGAWSTAAEIGPSTNSGYSPKVAIDSDGNAIAIWLQVAAISPTTIYSVWSNIYSGGSWGSAAELDVGVNIAAAPQIAFDATGNAMAVWKSSTGRLRYSMYSPNTGWGTPANVESGSDAAFVPQLAVDAEGNAIVVWRQSTNSRNSMWASRYQLGNGWSTPELLENDDTNPISNPGVAMAPNGSAFAIWIQSDGIVDNTWVSRFE